MSSKFYSVTEVGQILESAELDLTEQLELEQDEAYWYVGMTSKLAEEVLELRPVVERVKNLLGMKEQVVATLREELDDINSKDLGYTAVQRKSQIKGQLGQLEYEVKMLNGILLGE